MSPVQKIQTKVKLKKGQTNQAVTRSCTEKDESVSKSPRARELILLTEKPIEKTNIRLQAAGVSPLKHCANLHPGSGTQCLTSHKIVDLKRSLELII